MVQWPWPVGMYPGASRPLKPVRLLTGLRSVDINPGASPPDETGIRPMEIVNGLWPANIIPGTSRPVETGLRPVRILTGLWPVYIQKFYLRFYSVKTK